MSKDTTTKMESEESNPLIKKALLELRRLRNKLSAEQHKKHEPIAIVGTACRFANGVDNTEKLYELLKNGVDTVKEIPAERWDVDEYYDADPNSKGKMYTRHGSFIDQVDKFDAEFFNISGREANTLDPQQRLLLELTWEAMENAAIVNTAIPQKRAGIFIAGMNVDYAQLLNDAGVLDVHTSSGTMVAVAAGRLAYVLGLHGPTMIVDTACSSSLVAVHLACQSLRSRECDIALAGGANLMLAPHAMIIECSTRMLAPDGRSKTFDAAANGFGRGEGGGIVALKRLSDAQANNDNIIAVIRGSAVNHDGHSSGLSVPNGMAQESVIRAALENSKLEASDISYVEAHGTGTHLGDPIEIGALQGVFGKGRDVDKPLLVGSVKTNLGHLEWSAGITGLIKAAVSLQHNKILPQINFYKPNPLIDWDTLNIRIPTSCEPWPKATHPRAGVSSFGFSGTNSHVVLEQAPKVDREKISARGSELFVISAKNNLALNDQIKQYRYFLESNKDLLLEDVCFTTGVGRNHFLHRLSVQCSSLDELKNKLALLESGESAEGSYKNFVKENGVVKWAFLCTGQGSQYTGMGHELYKAEPVFRSILDQCNVYLSGQLPKSLLEVMFDKENIDELNKTIYTQPALYALEVALAALWSSWGIRPNVVLGHSLGEYAAAHIAGVFSLEDGLKLVSTRAKLMQALPTGGSMVAVMTSVNRLMPLIKDYENEISIAAINGPDNVVLSGVSNVLDSICETLETKEIKTHLLSVSHAFHSPLIEPMLAEFREAALNINYKPPALPIISNISGKRAGNEIASADYWLEHIRSPVEFSKGVQCLSNEGITHYLEIGPKPVLLGMARACIDITADRCFASLQSAQNDVQSMLSNLGKSYVQGCSINWLGLYENRFYRRAVLPAYPFQRKRYWVKPVNENEKSIETPPSSRGSGSGSESDITYCLDHADVEGLSQYIRANTALNDEQKKVLPVISKALIDSHQQNVENKTVKDWFYGVDWQETINSSVTDISIKSGYWIVLSNADLGQQLSQVMLANGQSCILVRHEQEYFILEDDVCTVNPAKQDDFDRLVKDIHDRFGDLLLGVIHSWAADEAIDPENDLDQAQIIGNWSLLLLIKSLLKQNIIPELGVWAVSRGIYPVDKGVSLENIAYSSLSGLAQSIALEYNDLWGGVIDLAHKQEALEAEFIIKHILSDVDENRIAYRNNKQFVPRLVKKVFERKNALKLKENACYIVTGGSGGLGLSVVNWLAYKGAKRIHVLARSVATEKVRSCIDSWQKNGVSIVLNQVDVSDPVMLKKVFESINKEQDLRGVIHAAGTLGDSLIKDMSWEKYTEVTSPKIEGGWNLHQLTKDIDLDFFVMFSSVASVFGAAGQANYAAGNSFIDALAYYRNQHGLPAISINWGPWADVGMAANLNVNNKTRMSNTGIKEIEVDAGLACLDILLVDNNINKSSQVSVLPINWAELGKLYVGKPGHKFLSEIPEFVNVQKKVSGKQSNIYQLLLNANQQQRTDSILGYLKKLVGDTLKIEESKLLDDTDLLDVGIDSLMIMEILDCVKRDMQLMIYPREVYANPKLDGLANYISAEFSSSGEDANTEKKSALPLTDKKDFLITNITDPRVGLGSDFKPLKSMVFLLSTPRAGSTLLRAMLAGHKELFSPPELHLLTFSSMAERDSSLKGTYLDEGLQRAIMDLQGEGSEKARSLIDEFIDRDAPVTEVYDLLQKLSGTRQVIDKSPTYALDPCILQRSEVMFSKPKYIHLVRNPISSIDSFARMRMDKLFSTGISDPYLIAEKVWEKGNENIDLFMQKLPKSQVHQVRFEDLVQQPDVVLKELCEFLDITYDPALLDPYSGNRMTDGVHKNSLSIGDPNFLEHKKIEPKKANAWKDVNLPNVLNEKTVQIARKFNYDISPLIKTISSLSSENLNIPMEESFIELRGLKFCICSWGNINAPVIFLIHGILDQGATWRKVAEKLANQGYRVIAPDLRGHGRSSPVGAGGSYSMMDFFADIDAIIDEIIDKPFILVGHSMGTILAAMYTSIHAQNIKALVLVETVLPVASGNQPALDQIKAQLKYLREPPVHPVLVNLDAAVEQLQTMTPSLDDEFAKFLASRITEPCESGIRWTWDPILSTRAGISGGTGIDKAGYLNILASIDVPTTLLFGESSRFLRPADLAELKTVMKNSRDYSIKGGHQLHNESPDQVAMYILNISEQFSDKEKASNSCSNLTHEAAI